MKASDSFPAEYFDHALDVVGPLIDHRRWHLKWRIFYLVRVGVARGQEWTAMPVRELAVVTGRTDYWVGKVLRSMVDDFRVLFRDPPYSRSTGSRAAAFRLNPAIADWRGVPWDLPREHVLARLGYVRERDRWVLPRSFESGINELSAALSIARQNGKFVPRSRRRPTAAQGLAFAAPRERGTNGDSAALTGAAQSPANGDAPPFSSASKEADLYTETQARGGSVDTPGADDVLEAVLEATGNAVWARPKQELLAIVKREGAQAVIARIHELADKGMHPAQLVELLAMPNAKRPERGSPQHRIATGLGEGAMTL